MRALDLTNFVDDLRFNSNILRVQNQAILKQYIERTLKTQAAEVWLARINEVGVPVAPLLSVAEAINLPQTQARNMLIEAGGIMMPGNPIKSAAVRTRMLCRERQRSTSMGNKFAGNSHRKC